MRNRLLLIGLLFVIFCGSGEHGIRGQWVSADGHRHLLLMAFERDRWHLKRLTLSTLEETTLGKGRAEMDGPYLHLFEVVGDDRQEPDPHIWTIDHRSQNGITWMAVLHDNPSNESLLQPAYDVQDAKQIEPIFYKADSILDGYWRELENGVPVNALFHLTRSMAEGWRVGESESFSGKIIRRKRQINATLDKHYTLRPLGGPWLIASFKDEFGDEQHRLWRRLDQELGETLADFRRRRSPYMVDIVRPPFLPPEIEVLYINQNNPFFSDAVDVLTNELNKYSDVTLQKVLSDVTLVNDIRYGPLEQASWVDLKHRRLIIEIAMLTERPEDLHKLMPDLLDRYEFHPQQHFRDLEWRGLLDRYGNDATKSIAPEELFSRLMMDDSFAADLSDDSLTTALIYVLYQCYPDVLEPKVESLIRNQGLPDERVKRRLSVPSIDQAPLVVVDAQPNTESQAEPEPASPKPAAEPKITGLKLSLNHQQVEVYIDGRQIQDWRNIIPLKQGIRDIQIYAKGCSVYRERFELKPDQILDLQPHLNCGEAP